MEYDCLTRDIDYLGRILIPKAIRKRLDIKEGEKMEIFVDKLDNIVLSKCFPDLDFRSVAIWCDQKAKEYQMENYNLYFVDKNHNPVGFFINKVNITDEEYESAFVRWASYGDTLYAHKHHILAFTHNGQLVLFAISDAPKEMVLKLSDEFYRKFECL